MKAWLLRVATSTTLASLLLGLELWPYTDGEGGRNEYLCNSYLDYSDMYWPFCTPAANAPPAACADCCCSVLLCDDLHPHRRRVHAAAGGEGHLRGDGPAG